MTAVRPIIVRETGHVHLSNLEPFEARSLSRVAFEPCLCHYVDDERKFANQVLQKQRKRSGGRFRRRIARHTHGFSTGTKATSHGRSGRIAQSTTSILRPFFA